MDDREEWANRWLAANDPEWREGQYEDRPGNELLSNQYRLDGEVKTVAEMADEGIPLVRGVPSRLCEECFEPFEPERDDGNAQRYCKEQCRKRAENRRLRPRKNPPRLRSRGPRRP